MPFEYWKFGRGLEKRGKFPAVHKGKLWGWRCNLKLLTSHWYHCRGASMLKEFGQFEMLWQRPVLRTFSIMSYSVCVQRKFRRNMLLVCYDPVFQRELIKFLWFCALNYSSDTIDRNFPALFPPTTRLLFIVSLKIQSTAPKWLL